MNLVNMRKDRNFKTCYNCDRKKLASQCEMLVVYVKKEKKIIKPICKDCIKRGEE